MEIKRRKFQGVLNILSFNRHFYFFGLLVLACLIAISILGSWAGWILWTIVAAFMYGLIMPLVVSAFVYDFSGYYEFNWLKKLDIKVSDRLTVLNINAGFDETSYILEKHFPTAQIKVFDFYDAKRHTEPAIVRARKVSHHYPGTKEIKTDQIPATDKSADLIFIISAVHEIRSKEEKVEFFKECHRVCKEDGRLVIVEHLRDFPNFIAFTIGFTHFFSAHTWRNTISAGGFRSVTGTKFTPFMSIFVCDP